MAVYLLFPGNFADMVIWVAIMPTRATLIRGLE